MRAMQRMAALISTMLVVSNCTFVPTLFPTETALVAQGEELRQSPKASQEAEMIAKAESILVQKFDISETLLRSSEVETEYGQVLAEYDEAIWIVQFWNPEAYHGMYTVRLSGDGTLLSYNSPYSALYEPNDDEMTGTTVAIPSDSDISEESALETAKELLREIGDYGNRMDCLSGKAYFLYGQQYNNGYEPVWLIHFYQDNILQEKMLLGYDGSYIDSAPPDKNFERTSRKDEGIGIRFGDLNFHRMTVEEKAQFSQKWIPIVEDYVRTHPYYANRNDLLYQATRHVYGIPSEEDLSQDEALALAQQAAVSLGANQATIENRFCSYTFDITDVTTPIWKIFMYGAELSDLNEMLKKENAQCYRISINAKTGEMIDACEFNIHEDGSAFAF